MDEQQLALYRSHVRGAATFILLGRHDAPMNAAKLVEMYNVDLPTATADIDAIVASEHHKVGGVFELKPTPTTN